MQIGFDAHLATHFCKEVACEFSNFVMPIGGEPPLLHENACSTVKFLPQSHMDGRFDAWQAARWKFLSLWLYSSTAFCSWSGN